MTTLVALLTAPPEPFVPTELVGTPMIAVALCHAGSLDQGKERVQPLRDVAPAPIDLLGPIPYSALQRMFDATAPTGIHAYWKTEYLHRLDDDAIDTIVAHAGRMRSPFAAIHIHHLEGAVQRVAEADAAFAHRDAPLVLNILGLWMNPAESTTHVDWVRALWQTIQPSATGAVYLNFLGEEGHDRVEAAYGADKCARLAELKKKFDPANLFRVNQNIRPAP